MVLIIVTLIGAGGPLMWFMSRFDKRNTEQHMNNMDLLKDIQADVHDIQKDVKTVDRRLSTHIDWHTHNNE